jgi:hypothetical protein
MKIVFRVDPNAVCNFYDCILIFYFTFCGLYHKNLKWLNTSDRIAIMNLVYIIVFTLHIFNFWRGSKSANGGPYLLVDLDPRGSISTSRFGPGGPNLLVDMDRGSKSTGVQINWDTGLKCHPGLKSYDITKGNLPLVWAFKTPISRLFDLCKTVVAYKVLKMRRNAK